MYIPRLFVCRSERRPQYIGLKVHEVVAILAKGGKIMVVTRRLSRVVNHSIFVTTRVKEGSHFFWLE